jgi:hypothetical protein
MPSIASAPIRDKAVDHNLQKNSSPGSSCPIFPVNGGKTPIRRTAGMKRLPWLLTAMIGLSVVLAGALGDTGGANTVRPYLDDLSGAPHAPRALSALAAGLFACAALLFALEYRAMGIRKTGGTGRERLFLVSQFVFFALLAWDAHFHPAGGSGEMELALVLAALEAAALYFLARAHLGPTAESVVLILAGTVYATSRLPGTTQTLTGDACGVLAAALILVYGWRRLRRRVGDLLLFGPPGSAFELGRTLGTRSAPIAGTPDPKNKDALPKESARRAVIS